MPNFISESAGIFFTVAVVERIVSRNLRLERDAELRPYREEATVMLTEDIRALSSNMAVVEPPEVGESADNFAGRWLDEMPTGSASGPQMWWQRWRGEVRRVASDVAEARPLYATGLAPRMIVALDQFVRVGNVSFEHAGITPPTGDDIADLLPYISALRKVIQARDELDGHNLGTDFLESVADTADQTGAQPLTPEQSLEIVRDLEDDIPRWLDAVRETPDANHVLATSSGARIRMQLRLKGEQRAGDEIWIAMPTLLHPETGLARNVRAVLTAIEVDRLGRDWASMTRTQPLVNRRDARRARDCRSDRRTQELSKQQSATAQSSTNGSFSGLS